MRAKCSRSPDDVTIQRVTGAESKRPTPKAFAHHGGQAEHALNPFGFAQGRLKQRQMSNAEISEDAVSIVRQAV
jgi:hypothetical protein